MSAPADNKVVMLKLFEKVSAKGRRYAFGYLGEAKVVAFVDEREDEQRCDSSAVWAVYVAPKEDKSRGESSGGGGGGGHYGSGGVQRPPRPARRIAGRCRLTISTIYGMEAEERALSSWPRQRPDRSLHK
jgi:hypothetical protein